MSELLSSISPEITEVNVTDIFIMPEESGKIVNSLPPLEHVLSYYPPVSIGELPIAAQNVFYFRFEAEGVGLFSDDGISHEIFEYLDRKKREKEESRD
jgi:hypothetical protein